MLAALSAAPIRAFLGGIPGLVLLLGALGCTSHDSGNPGEPGDSGITSGDADGDGYPAAVDCNDADASVHPGAPEVCDGVDQDCDGEIDESAIDAGTFYADADSDGQGDPMSPVAACEAPEDHVWTTGDCNDANATIYTGAVELCDELDNDCDGSIDEGAGETWYLDADGDGWGDEAVSQFACNPGSSYVPAPSDGLFDCNDLDPAFHPGADESDCTDRNDYNCDGSVVWADADADGAAACVDCDDHDPRALPDATEICDGVDNDCDGLVDDDDPDVADRQVFYLDADADGYGIDSVSATACFAPDGYSGVAGDCNDGDARIHPGAVETDCTDPTDYNCDGSSGWADADADGTPACEDCNDTDPSVYPGAVETCNGTDDDCDSLVDDEDTGVTGTHVFYADADADGYGNSGVTVEACLAPDGFVSVTSGVFDCDDTDGSVYPGAIEICGDDLDQDCDGTECPSTGDVIFTEIMQNPSVTADSVGEWFELFNVSSWDMNLSGFEIRDDATDHFTIPDTTLVRSLDSIVFVRSSEGITSPEPDVVWTGLGTMQLANASDSLSLVSAAGSLVDAVFWDDGATFPDPDGYAMSLDPTFYDHVSNDVGTNWCQASDDATYTPADHGTPGEMNPTCDFGDPIPPDTGG